MVLQVVPNRVLTESVSFGRFANETLAWERWSAFTQNRYLEEVERFTKPGSVAQKKAFFEAHFKNRASGRVTQPRKIEEVETSDEIVCEVPKDILVDSEVTLVVSNGEVDETTDVKTGEVENMKSVVVLEDNGLDEVMHQIHFLLDWNLMVCSILSTSMVFSGEFYFFEQRKTS